METEIAIVRRFTRVFSPIAGLLEEGYLGSPFTLTQVRVMHDLAKLGEQTALDLRDRLKLDAGYLSRLLSGMEAAGIVTRRTSPDDGRKSIFRLTEAGLAAWLPLDRKADDLVRGLLERLSPQGRGELVEAMTKIEALLLPLSEEPGTRQA